MTFQVAVIFKRDVKLIQGETPAQAATRIESYYRTNPYKIENYDFAVTALPLDAAAEVELAPKANEAA